MAMRISRMGWLVACLLLASAGGCKDKSARSGAGAKAYVVGFSQIGAESAWRTAETASVREEAARRGVELKLADAQGKQANQIRAVRSFVQQKVDVIVLAPVVNAGWDAVLDEARRSKIPVVLLDRKIETQKPDLYVTVVTADTVEEGRLAGRFLAQKCGGKAKIVELQGTTGSAPAIDRYNGFREAIAAHPEMKIVVSQSADFERSKGKQLMEAIIKSQGGDFQAVFAHNDDMALGAIQALEEAGLRPGRDVLVVSIDGIKAAFEAMVAGKLNASVECDPLFGPLLFDTIEKIRAGQSVPGIIRNQPRVYDTSNAAAAIDSRKY